MKNLLIAAAIAASVATPAMAQDANVSHAEPLPVYVDKVGGFKGMTTDPAQVVYFSARCATIFTAMSTTVENDSRPAAKEFFTAMDSATKYYLTIGKTASEYNGHTQADFYRVYHGLVKTVGREYIALFRATYESSGDMFTAPLVRGDMDTCKAFAAFLKN